MNLLQDSTISTAYLMLEWSIRVVALGMVPFRRSPDSARAWLLLLLFLPVPGLFLYLLIGRPTYPRRRIDRLARARMLLDSATRELAHSRHCRQPDLPAGYEQAALLIERLGRFPAMAGNTVELLTDYESATADLVAYIDAAEHHVHILMYIFADDATGNLVMDALSRAAKRGVACRVLIDAIGSRPWGRAIRRRLVGSGVAVVTALPVAPWRRGSARADLRNHRKLVIIDGTIAYVGSQNIIDAQVSRRVVNEELMARVAGPVAVEAQTVFAVDWFLETDEVLSGDEYFRHLHRTGSATAQLMPSGPDYGEAGLGPLSVALVHAARHRVVITTPYFIPEAALLQALGAAVLRGVAVHLIVPQVSDQLLVRLAQRSYYAELIDAGVTVHRYNECFLHAKHVSVDDEVVLIGSSNVDVRSFVLNSEATLIVYDRQVSARLRREQDRYVASSVRLTREIWHRRPLAVKLIENLARLVSPLL